MNTMWSRIRAGSIAALYGLFAVVGPAGLHAWIDHHHHTDALINDIAQDDVAQNDTVQAADTHEQHHGHRHHHGDAHAGHAHDSSGHHHHHTHHAADEHDSHSLAQHSHAPHSHAPGSHRPGEDHDCLLCQSMITPAQVVVPVVVELVACILMTDVVPDVFALPATKTSSTLIRGPPALV